MNEKIKYQNLLYNLNNISTNLLNGIRNLESASNYSKNSINIDGVCYKKNDIESLINELKKQYNYLHNIYIPEVKKKIMEAK